MLPARYDRGARGHLGRWPALIQGDNMSNVIDFLARMGGDATLRDAGSADLALELAAAGVDGELAGAILAGDDRTVRASVAPGTFYAIQLDREKEQQDPEKEEKDDEETSIRHARSA